MRVLRTMATGLVSTSLVLVAAGACLQLCDGTGDGIPDRLRDGSCVAADQEQLRDGTGDGIPDRLRDGSCLA